MSDATEVVIVKNKDKSDSGGDGCLTLIVLVLVWVAIMIGHKLDTIIDLLQTIAK